MTRRLRQLLPLLVLAVGCWSNLPAQLDRATLVGAVTDSTGAVVPNASVTVSSEETGLRRAAQTNDSGSYAFPQLPIGVYVVTVSHPGMRTATTKDVRLGVGDNRTLNIQLEVSGTDTTVTVEGTAAALETESPVIGSVIGSRQVREI